MTLFTSMLPRETFHARTKELRQLVRRKYPSSHWDYYIFLLAILSVIASAAFSLVARAAGVSMWYPLLLLVFPAILSLWTSRRRSTMVYRIKEFEKTLKSHLGDLNKRDASQHHLKWTVRRATRSDRVEKATACLVIELAQCDPEVDVDPLPTYQEASEHVDTDHVMIQINHRPALEIREVPPPHYSETEVVVHRMEDMSSNFELRSISSSTSTSTSIHMSTEQTHLVGQDEDKPENT
ncbi:hypothetical protein INT44_004175 [Umbelopsis vinacea]|uniref:Uncharacterized protein n=1 Tax=Umbelopsis vinacea TaxID=44442 RepID=A0A8H7QAR5_9FUNG|nr:hypothetical protein INT44_004175 [Umbelopsis vinacea]